MKKPLKLERSSLAIDGRKVAVDVTTLPRHGSGHGKETPPRLRFDKVVLRVTERLQAAAAGCAPAGVTVIVTLTAPIKVAARTAIAIEDTLRALVAHRAAEPHASLTGLGNRVRIQFVKHRITGAPKLITFVHNPGTDPRLFVNMTREMLDLAKATARRRANARGLVVMCPRNSVCLDAYRYIYSQLRGATTAAKILMVFSDGRAELLTENRDRDPPDPIH
jgi:hypothetical protein